MGAIAVPWLVVAALGALMIVLVVVIVGMGIDLSATRRREHAANQQLIDRSRSASPAEVAPSGVRLIEGGVVNVTHGDFAYFRLGGRLMRAPTRTDGTFVLGDAVALDLFSGEDPAVFAHVLDALDALDRDALRNLAADA